MLPMRTRWIFWAAVAVQLCWAIGIVSDPSALFSTPVSALHDFFRSRWLLVGLLALSSALTLRAVVRDDHTVTGLGCMVLGQFLLTVAAIGSMNAIRTSQFADGVERPSAFIFTDQSSTVIFALAYTAAMVETFGRGSLWKRRP